MLTHPRLSASFPSPARPRLRGTALALALLIALLPARPSSAAWQPDGVPLSPMPTTYQFNSMSGLVSDGSGGAFTVWQLEELNPITYVYGYALRAQRVDQAGNRPSPWTANGSTIRSWLADAMIGTYAITTIGLYPDGGGGAVLAVLDDVIIVEYQTLFRLYGIAPGGAVTAISITNATFGGYPTRGAAVDGDGAGGVVMVGLEQTFSQPPNPRPAGRLFAQRVSGAGEPLFPSDLGYGVPLNTLGDTAPGGVAALSDGAGGGFFAWADLREPGDPDLYVLHLDAAGALASGWPATGVLVCGATGAQRDPHLALDGAGGVIVVWRDDRSGSPRLYGHVVLAGGTLAPGVLADGRQIPSSDPSDTFSALVDDGSGGCFVARSGAGIARLHRLDATMQARSGWPGEGVALNTIASGGAAGLVSDGLDGAYVCFRNGLGTTALQGLYAQHIAADGSVAPGWSAGGYRLSGTGKACAIVRSGIGAIVAWDDARSSYPGIYAQSILADGPVAAQLDLVSASAAGGRVALRWYSADGPALRATLERSVDGAGWGFLAEVSADGTGHIGYDDAAVTPGTRYGYRLTWRDGAVTRTSRETWIVVPRDLALALEAPSPNPSNGTVTLAVTLPDARGATLEVFDLAGRRIATRDLAGLGAGRHVVALREAASLTPGLYVVQLTQARAARRVRLVRTE